MSAQQQRGLSEYRIIYKYTFFFRVQYVNICVVTKENPQWAADAKLVSSSLPFQIKNIEFWGRFK